MLLNLSNHTSASWSESQLHLCACNQTQSKRHQVLGIYHKARNRGGKRREDFKV